MIDTTHIPTMFDALTDIARSFLPVRSAVVGEGYYTHYKRNYKMGWHIVENESGETVQSKKVYYPVKDEAGETMYRRSGKLNFECHFKHDAVGMDQAWKITYALRKRKDEEGNQKYTHNFNIHAPDRKVPRRAHKLDDVMIVVKNAIFKGRNTTGSLDFNSFKRKMTEIVNKDFADNVANEFVSKIKEAVAG